ncbi:MAG TPA: TetR/AcrR family transcriptional regulator [Acidimicrobiales bacterium]|nr:TetR/AcrR family transcriptional regulator [Acidimicrobiales bacterium]
MPGPQDAETTVAVTTGAVTTVAGVGKPMRADARRNYDRLVVAAGDVFARDGGGASMEAIAREAGVGVGTLYRHFPRRIDVVEAVYRTDVDDLARAAEDAVAALEPWPAVVAFLEGFVRYAETNRTLLAEWAEAFDKYPGLRSPSRDRIDDAAQLVVGRAQAAGAMRTDVDGADLMGLLIPVCTSPALAEDRTGRLLGVILDGLARARRGS